MDKSGKPQSLAEYLGVVDPKLPEVPPFSPPGKLSAKAFCQAVLNSSEFRTYILNGLVLGNIPPAILLRVMDTGWGKPVERVELRDRSDTLDALTPEIVEEKLARVQRMLRVIQSYTNDEVESRSKQVH